MAYVPDQNQDQNQGDPAGGGPTQLSQGSVASGGGGVVEESGKPGSSRSGASSNFQRYATLLKPQGKELATDFVGGIRESNQSRLGGQLKTAQDRFTKDRLASTRTYDQNILSEAMRTAQDSAGLRKQRETGYAGPAGLETTGIASALQRAEADRRRLDTAEGRKGMLTQQEGITPGMAALDNFLMQGQRDVFEGATFAKDLRAEAGRAGTEATGQAGESAAINQATAERMEQELQAGTRQHYAQQVEEQRIADLSRQRVASGKGVGAGDYGRVGLTEQQVAQLRSGLGAANIGRSASGADIFGDNPQSAQGMVNDIQTARFGVNPNARKMLGKYGELNSVQGVIDNMINPNISTNRINTGAISQDAGTSKLLEYLNRTGVNQGGVDRLNALEKLSGIDAGDLQAQGTNDMASILANIQKYGAGRERAFQGQVDTRANAYNRALNQARTDRAAGVGAGGRHYRRFDG